MLVLALAFLATVSADGYFPRYGAPRPPYGRYSYNGPFYGECYGDGIYYNDATSFIYCSNGNVYRQPCAPGSRNGSPYSYRTGRHYGFQDFCGVNLVDRGYNDFQRSHGNRYQSPNPEEQEPSYRPPQPAPRRSYAPPTYTRPERNEEPERGYAPPQPVAYQPEPAPRYQPQPLPTRPHVGGGQSAERTEERYPEPPQIPEMPQGYPPMAMSREAAPQPDPMVPAPPEEAPTYVPSDEEGEE